MGITFALPWEIPLLEWLQASLGEIGVFLARGITLLGEEVIIIALLSFLYWCYDKKMGRFVGINLTAAMIAGSMIKNLVLRRRPYFDHPSVRPYKKADASGDLYDITAQGYSFPSMHSLNSTALYGSIPVYRKKGWLWIVGIAVPFLIGLSRLQLGVHYPTDVLVGWGVGALFVALLSFVQKKVNRPILYGILTALALIGCFFCHTSDYYTCLGTMIGFFAADLFEERFVRFRNTRTVWIALLRVAVGFGIFFGLNALLKLPFSPELLASPTAGAFAVRSARYALTVFVLMGVYPLSFRLIPDRKAV